MKLFISVLFAVPVALIGCGGDSDGGGGVTSGATSGTGPQPNEFRFDTPAYNLEPGEEKRYMCITTRIPADKPMIVREITPTYGKGTHHLGVYYTMSDEPDGVFECPELVRDNWIPLYGGGIESGSLKAPDNAGFHLQPNQQILVQLHLFNTGGTPIDDKARITFKTTDDQATIQAGMFGFDNRAIAIPAHSKNVMQEMDCTANVDMDVFAVFGHMHQRGKTIAVGRDADVVYEDSWSFDDQPTTPVNFHVAATDKLNLRCSYDNDGDDALGYGESSNQEMCAFVFYYTPYKSLNGCLKLPE